MARALEILAFTVTLAAVISPAVAQTNPIARPGGAYVINIQPRNPISSPLANGTQPVPPPTSTLGPITPVPEPSTWTMLLGGLVVLGFFVRRTNRR